MSKELQGPYLNALHKEKIPVAIYLINGIKLHGQVKSFDQFCATAGGIWEPNSL